MSSNTDRAMSLGAACPSRTSATKSSAVLKAVGLTPSVCFGKTQDFPCFSRRRRATPKIVGDVDDLRDQFGIADREAVAVELYVVLEPSTAMTTHFETP